MNYRDLTAYLHQLRPDEVPGLVVGYDIEHGQGVGRMWNQPRENFLQYPVRPSFRANNPHNAFLEAPPFHIAKNGRLNTNPPHHQDYYELVYVLEGEIHCAVNGTELCVPAGAALLLSAGVEHHMYTCTMEDIAVSVFWDPDYLTPWMRRILDQLPTVGPLYQSAPAQPWLLVDFGIDATADQVGRSLLCNYFDPNRHSDLIVVQLLLLFLIELDNACTPLASQRPEEGIEALLPAITRYIEVHCQQVTLEEVAQRFGYAGNYLSAALRQHYGMGFTRFRNSCRLEQAAVLLRSTQRPVTEIAAEVGFGSLSHFYQQFIQRFSLPPMEYRQLPR